MVTVIQHHHHLRRGRMPTNIETYFCVEHNKQHERVLPGVSQDICAGITADLC